MSNDGTQITISSSHLISNSNGWHDSNGLQNRRLKLTSAADQNATTQAIVTSPDVGVYGGITSLTGTGFAKAAHFERNGTMIINGANLGASSVTMVDSNGNEISGVSALTAANGVSFGATIITVPEGAFDGDGNETDTTLSQGRRVRITFSNGNPTVYSSATTGFTVSNVASYNGDSNATFFGSGIGFDEDNSSATVYDYNSSIGNLTINGSNFMGIINIYLTDSNGSDANGTLATLTRSAIEGAGGSFTHEKIIIPTAQLTPSGWADQNGSYSSRHIILESIADRNQTSPIIGVD